MAEEAREPGLGSLPRSQAQADAAVDRAGSTSRAPDDLPASRRILRDRALTSLWMLPVVAGAASAISGSIIQALIAPSWFAVSVGLGTALTGVAVGLLGMALWPLAVFRATASARIGIYLAIVAVPVAVMGVASARTSWDGSIQPAAPAPLWLLACGGAIGALVGAAGALAVARPTLRPSPWEVVPASETPAPRWRPARLLHLLWTVPLAVILSAFPLFVAALSLCGISGCSGGGFGVDSSEQFLTWWMCALVGVLFGLAVGLVPWVRRWRIRLAAGVLVTFVVGGVLAAWFAAQLR